MAEGQEVWRVEGVATGVRENARHRGKSKEPMGNMH